MDSRGDVTILLGRIAGGDKGAFDELLPRVYDELRKVARRYMRGERMGHSLQATALTHEAYLRLLGGEIPDLRVRAQFFAAAAGAMRQILIEHARARAQKKRGGGWARITIGPALAGDGGPDLDLLALEEALTFLSRSHPRKARVVELLYFGGMTAAEAALVLGVTSRTVERDWRFARLWLLQKMLAGC